MDFSNLTSFFDSIAGSLVPGTDCEVRLNGKRIYRYMAGYRDMEKKIPVDGSERYFMYSVSKVITVTAAMQLYEKGLFLLDDPLGDYLPEFANMYVGEEPAKNVLRVRNLFTMSAGLDYDFSKAPIKEAISKNPQAPTRDIVRAIAASPLNFEPGTRWCYSLCHDVLAGFVEVVSGMRFADYVKKNIFEPCFMDTASYHDVTNVAPQYSYSELKKAPVPVACKNVHILGEEYDSGGAGVICSVDDYIQFLDSLTRFRLISPNTVKLMTTDQLSDDMRPYYNWDVLRGYGYGLGVRTNIMSGKRDSLANLGEFGWGGAAGAFALSDPSIGLCVFYAQHMLNNKEPYVHPRIRNIVYSAIG